MDPLSDLDSTSPPSHLLRVALWLEDPLVQAGLMVLLEGAEGVEVVPEDDSDVAVILWDADAASELAPPLTAGQPPVLALVADLERSTTLLARGVAGVLSRRSSSVGLAAGLRAVSAGLLVVPRGSLDALLPKLPEAVANLPLDPLTARELEVLGLVAEGLTNRAVADRLEVTESTVKFHLNALLSKFAADTRTELVVRAIQTGDLHI